MHVTTLAEFRQEISDLDQALVAMLAKRLTICLKVAVYKLGNSEPVMQPNQVSEVKRRNAEIGIALGLDSDFVIDLYDLIITEACRLEEVEIRRAKAGINIRDKNQQGSQ